MSVFRGRIDSEFNRNVVHLGLAGPRWRSRRDRAADRTAVRDILIGLMMQDVPQATVGRIRHGLSQAIALGDDQERATVRDFVARLTDWYDRMHEGDVDALASAFDELLAAIESFAARQFREKAPQLTPTAVAADAGTGPG